MPAVTTCARAIPRNGARDGLAMLDTPVPRSACGRHEEDEAKGCHGLTSCVPSSAAIILETSQVEVGRIAMGGPRATRP